MLYKNIFLYVLIKLILHKRKKEKQKIIYLIIKRQFPIAYFEQRLIIRNTSLNGNNNIKLEMREAEIIYAAEMTMLLEKQNLLMIMGMKCGNQSVNFLFIE